MILRYYNSPGKITLFLCVCVIFRHGKREKSLSKHNVMTGDELHTHGNVEHFARQKIQAKNVPGEEKGRHLWPPPSSERRAERSYSSVSRGGK